MDDNRQWEKRRQTSITRVLPARLHSLVVAWIAVLALVAQMAVAQQHGAMAETAAARAAAELVALIGQDFVICAQDKGFSPSGSPAHDPGRCGDECPLCQLTQHLAGIPPTGHFSLAPVSDYVTTLSIVADERGYARRRVTSAQPRAPPIPV